MLYIVVKFYKNPLDTCGDITRIRDFWKFCTFIFWKILANALRYTKPGGRLEYSTCTLNKNENEELVKHVLSNENTSARIIEMTTFMPYNGKVGFYYCIIGKTAI